MNIQKFVEKVLGVKLTNWQIKFINKYKEVKINNGKSKRRSSSNFSTK